MGGKGSAGRGGGAEPDGASDDGAAEGATPAVVDGDKDAGKENQEAEEENAEWASQQHVKEMLREAAQARLDQQQHHRDTSEGRQKDELLGRRKIEHHRDNAHCTMKNGEKAYQTERAFGHQRTRRADVETENQQEEEGSKESEESEKEIRMDWQKCSDESKRN